MHDSRTRHTGFSLVELLACIAIVAVLLGMVLPLLAGARESARDARCRSNVRQLAIVATIYADEQKSLPIPDGPGPLEAFEVPAGAWICPSDPERGEARGGVSYDYWAPTVIVYRERIGGPRVVDMTRALRFFANDSGKLPIFQDAAAWHGHSNAGYFHGAVRSIRPGDS